MIVVPALHTVVGDDAGNSGKLPERGTIAAQIEQAAIGGKSAAIGKGSHR